MTVPVEIAKLELVNIEKQYILNVRIVGWETVLIGLCCANTSFKLLRCISNEYSVSISTYTICNITFFIIFL